MSGKTLKIGQFSEGRASLQIPEFERLSCREAHDGVRFGVLVSVALRARRLARMNHDQTPRFRVETSSRTLLVMHHFRGLGTRWKCSKVCSNHAQIKIVQTPSAHWKCFGMKHPKKIKNRNE